MDGYWLSFRWMASLLILCCLPLAGCQSAYYGTMEKLGVHKREIMVDRVGEARDSQQEAKEQFRSALERFSSVVDFQGGELEKKYQALDEEYQKSKSRAEEVRHRIDSVEEVAQALFEEWEKELEQYSSAPLRRSSAEQLQRTRRQYKQLIAAMHQAEDKMGPVLAVFQDHVLFLKHNLNARAINSLKGELNAVRIDVEQLLQDMERSIAEADDFIQAFKGER